MTSFPLSLHATAALVMHWGYPAFSGRAKYFADHLDLSAARVLITSCESVCPWYGEVIANRKAAIRYLASEYIAAAESPVTVIIPAAGWSPLALELVEGFSDRVQIIELDIAGMREKQVLYNEIDPGFSGRIHCLTADITNPGCLHDCIPADRSRLLVILEGITYFMNTGWVEQIVRTCSHRETAYIIEYLLPAEMMKPGRRYIADHVFSVVSSACSCPPPVRYSPGLLREMADTYGYTRLMTMTVREMELLRTGENRYFTEDTDGWINVSLIW